MHKTETTNFSLHIARTREMGILQRWMPVGRTVVIIAILLWISLCEANLREIANRKWTVANLPTGQFQSSRDLALSPPEILDLEAIELRHDEVLVQLESVTVEAFIRTMLQRHSFHFSLKPGDPVLAFGIGKVLRTGGEGAKAFKVGSNVMGYFPVANYVTVNVKASLLESVPRFLGVPPVVHLTLFGSAGLSAYAGLFRSAGSLPPRRGETVVISAAAGGVGICAAQMAKQTGARVVGIAGGPHKRNFLLEVVGVDEVVDYKETSNSLEDQLKKACPNGIDFFFDNVGGVILDNVLNQLNRGARVVICGAISLYDGGNSDEGPKNYIKLAEQSATMSGFVFRQLLERPLARWKAKCFILWHYLRGNLKVFEQSEEGIESFGLALEKLLRGDNIGRLIVNLRP